MEKEKIVKITGIALSVTGVALNVATGFLDDKKMEMKIAKEVSKQLRRNR